MLLSNERYVKRMQSKRRNFKSLHLIEDKLFIVYQDSIQQLDENNISDVFNIMYKGAGNLHVYKIVDGKYHLLKVYNMYRKSVEKNMKRKYDCMDRFGDDVVMYNLPSNRHVSLHGMDYIEDESES